MSSWVMMEQAFLDPEDDLDFEDFDEEEDNDEGTD